MGVYQLSMVWCSTELCVRISVVSTQFFLVLVIEKLGINPTSDLIEGSLKSHMTNSQHMLLKKSLHDRFERLFDVFEVSRSSLWSLILPFTEQQHHSTMVSNAQLFHFKGFCQMRAIQIRTFGMCSRLPCADRRKDLKWWHNHVNLLIKIYGNRYGLFVCSKMNIQYHQSGDNTWSIIEFTLKFSMITLSLSLKR